MRIYVFQARLLRVDPQTLLLDLESLSTARLFDCHLFITTDVFHRLSNKFRPLKESFMFSLKYEKKDKYDQFQSRSQSRSGSRHRTGPSQHNQYIFDYKELSTTNNELRSEVITLMRENRNLKMELKQSKQLKPGYRARPYDKYTDSSHALQEIQSLKRELSMLDQRKRSVPHALKENYSRRLEKRQEPRHGAQHRLAMELENASKSLQQALKKCEVLDRVNQELSEKLLNQQTQKVLLIKEQKLKFENTVSSLKESHQKQQTVNGTLKQQLKSLQCRFRDQDLIIQKIINQKAKCQELNSVLNKQIAGMRSQLNSQKQKNTEKEQNRHNQVQGLASLVQKLKLQLKQAQSHQSCMQKLQKQLQQIQILNYTVEKLQKQLKEAQSHYSPFIENLQKQLKEAQSHSLLVEKLQKELYQAEQLFKTSNQQKQQLQTKLQDSISKASKLAQQLETKELSISSLQSSILQQESRQSLQHELSQITEQFKEENESTLQQLQKQTQANEQLVKQIQQLKSDNNCLKQKLQSKMTELLQTTFRLQKATQSNKQLNIKLNRSNNQIIKLQKQLDFQKNLCCSSAERQKELQLALQQLKSYKEPPIQTLQAEVDAKYHQLQLVKQLQQANNSLQQLSNQNEQLKYISNELKKQLQSLLEDESKELKIASLQQQINVLSQKAHLSQNQVKGNQASQIQINRLKASLDQTFLQIHQLNAAKSILLKQIDQLKNQLSMAQEQLNMFQEQMGLTGTIIGEMRQLEGQGKCSRMIPKQADSQTGSQKQSRSQNNGAIPQDLAQQVQMYKKEKRSLEKELSMVKQQSQTQINKLKFRIEDLQIISKRSKAIEKTNETLRAQLKQIKE